MSVYSKLAYQAIDQFIRHQSVLAIPAAPPPELRLQRACFVRLYENPGRHFLSQSGHILPQGHSLAEDIISHSVAAVRLCRKRLRRVDLSALDLLLLILDPLQRISDPSQLDPTYYGLYLRSDQGHRSIVLPNRPGIDSADVQLATAIREAGVNLSAHSIHYYRFGVNYFT